MCVCASRVVFGLCAFGMVCESNSSQIVVNWNPNTVRPFGFLKAGLYASNRRNPKTVIQRAAIRIARTTRTCNFFDSKPASQVKLEAGDPFSFCTVCKC